MFCPNCGSPNPENAAHCGSCGTHLGQPAAAHAAGPPGPHQSALPVGTVPNHMGLAIGSLVVNLLGCCLPVFGIIAVVYASQVNGKLQMGDQVGAQAAAESAKLWSIVGLVVGGIFLVISIGGNVASLLLVESGGY